MGKKAADRGEVVGEPMLGNEGLGKPTGGGQPSLVGSYMWQLYALMYKNWVLFRRQWISSLVHLFAPALCVILFGLVVKASNTTTFERDPAPFMSMGGAEGDTLINRCVVFDATGGRFGFGMPIKSAPCLTLVYSPKTTEVDAIMQQLARQNGLTMDVDIRGFADSTALINYFSSDEAIPVFAGVVFNSSGVLTFDVPTTTGPQGEQVDQRTKLPLGAAPATSVLAYEIWYNKTVTKNSMLKNAGLDGIAANSESGQSYVLQVQHAVSAAILGAHTGSNTAEIKLDIKPFPQVEGENVKGGSGSSFELSAEQFGALFYLVGIMMSFIITLRQIVQEKEDKILDALRMMGLYESCYWLSWTIYYAVLMLVASILMVLAGMAMDVNVFKQTTASWMVFTLFSYLMSMAAFSMALSTLMPNTKAAIMAGFLLLALALIFQLVVSVQFFDLFDLMYSPYRLSDGARNLINLYPPLLFAKVENMMYGMTKDRAARDPVTGEFALAPGTYTWEDAAGGAYQYANPIRLETINRTLDYAEVCRSGQEKRLCYVHQFFCGGNDYLTCASQQCSYDWSQSVSKQVCEAVDGAAFILNPGSWQPTECLCLFSLPSDLSSVLAMYGAAALWIVLAWYLGQVWTFGHGRAERAWFPLTPWYWFGSLGVKNPFASAGAQPLMSSNEVKDPDVTAEERAVAGGERMDQSRYPVVLRDLVRDFGGGFLGLTGSPFRAVNGLTLALEKGSCFALLGHNGAGKTTAINILSGMIAPSGGDCMIYGKSVRDSMGSIRHEVGVCPQHDILWAQLTAREHLRFYGHFQGMGLRQVRDQGEYLLKQVHLDKLSRVAGNYSGGMRRRLSMTIAALGNKRIVFLDEPTTGLDPQNQRHVWDMINELKKDRVVILTTHLMDEADMLGDRIGIMSKGRLVALGNALHLKSKFGGNYKVTVSPADGPGARKALLDNILRTMPSAEVDPESAASSTGPLIFTIRPSAFKDAARLFRRVDEIIAEGGAKDWGLSQTSLEDVFVSLDEQEKAPKLKTALASQLVEQAMFNDVGVPIANVVGGGEGEVEFAEDAAFHDSFMGQARALFRKSVTLQLRQRKTVCCQISIPLILIAAMGALLIVLENEILGNIANDNFYNGGNYDGDFENCRYCLISNVEMMRSFLENLDESSGPFCSYPDCAVGQFANKSEISSSFTSSYQDSLFMLDNRQVSNKKEFEQAYGAEKTAKVFAMSNEFYSHCVTSDTSQRCLAFDESERLSQGDLLMDPALWFGSDLHAEVDNFRIFIDEPRYDTTLAVGSRIVFGASSPGITAALGSRCVADVQPDESGLLVVNNDTIVFQCFGGSGGYSSSVFPPEKLFLSFGEGFSLRNRESCSFINATAAQEVLGPLLSAATVGGGVLAQYPVGVRRTEVDFEEGNNNGGYNPGSTAQKTATFWNGVDICPISSLSRFSALSAELRNGDPGMAVNEMLIQAQEDYRNGRNEFVGPLPRTFEGLLAASKIFENSFPEAALFFSELDLAKGRVAFTLQTYLGESTRCAYNGEYAFTGVDMDEPLRAEDFYGGSSSCKNLLIRPIAGSVKVEDEEYVQQANLVNNVLNGLVSALLRSAPASASSPLAGAGNVELAVGVRPFPYGEDAEQAELAQVLMNEIYTIMGSVLVPLATSFLLPVFVFHIVHEKENKLRANMLMMGLRMRAYWAVQYAFDMTLAVIALGLCYVLGLALGAPVFANHQFGIVLILLLLWANAQVGLAFLLSVFFSRTRNANIALYLLVLASAIAGFVLNTLVFSETPYLPAPAWFVWFPPFAYCRGVYLLTQRSYFWEDLDGSDEMVKVWGYLIIEAIVCFAATLYLDVVLPKEFGVRRGPFFPIEDLIAAVKGMVSAKPVGPQSSPEYLEMNDDEDEDEAGLDGDDADVIKERRLVLADSPEVADAPIRIVNLKKQFGAFQAVDGLTMHMKDRSLTSLLGANGAGKSTTISMLTGLYGPSGGNAFVDGKSIRTKMHEIYQVIGVCPQHDVTWPELTVKEHLLLYARLKGASRSDEFRVVQNAIAAVQLNGHEQKRARQLSGGQRRRLSIAISFLGNPRVTFLDEPTTGVDPVTRSHVHELVMREKKKRCIVLTTHLMSESEKLSDRIAIMGHGKLKTIGTATALKTKYNEGFKLILVVADEAAARAFVAKSMPDAVLESKINAKMVYRIESGADIHLADVWETMQARSDGNGISDWQISATTLEDVFVQIAAASEKIYGTA